MPEKIRRSLPLREGLVAEPVDARYSTQQQHVTEMKRGDY
jgi:hypothetical protein